MKYNIAFVPKENQSNFINLADEICKTTGYKNYKLGKYSIPHISLCHFEYKHDLDTILDKVTCLKIPDVQFVCGQIRSKSYPGHAKWGGVSWVSLIPDKLEILKEIHLMMASIIKKPLNESFDKYDPHLTLFNSENSEVCDKFNDEFFLEKEIVEIFHLAIGEIDNNGQLISTIYTA